MQLEASDKPNEDHMNVESTWKKHNLHIAKPLQTRFQQSSIFLNCENKQLSYFHLHTETKNN